MLDIKEAAPENSLIDLSDNEIDIEIESVLIRDFPEDEFSSEHFKETLLCYIFAFCC